MRISDCNMTKAILRRHSFTCKRTLGQNFLIDSSVLRSIINTSEINKTVNVVEIGPGIGSLTEFLAEQASEVMAFEIDGRLFPILMTTLNRFDNVLLICQDILTVDFDTQMEQFSNPNLPVKIVANLPYCSATSILMRLIENRRGLFSDFVVMMQKEVADRIAAVPNTKGYGNLSIAIQYYMNTQISLIVPRTSFFPSPNVDSAVLKLERRKKPLVEVQNKDFFFDVVRASFAHRRKTLWNNLIGYFGKSDVSKEACRRAIAASGLSLSVRGEGLSIEDFAKLADNLGREVMGFNSYR